MDKRAALFELLVVLDKRCARNSIRRLFLHRLDQERELQRLRSRDALAARDDDESRHMNLVIMQDLFRDPLVLAKRQPGRAATGKRQLLHFEK